MLFQKPKHKNRGLRKMLNFVFIKHGKKNPESTLDFLNLFNTLYIYVYEKKISPSPSCGMVHVLLKFGSSVRGRFKGFAEYLSCFYDCMHLDTDLGCCTWNLPEPVCSFWGLQPLMFIFPLGILWTSASTSIPGVPSAPGTSWSSCAPSF